VVRIVRGIAEGRLPRSGTVTVQEDCELHLVRALAPPK
jgi:hypothetical protein